MLRNILAALLISLTGFSYFIVYKSEQEKLSSSKLGKFNNESQINTLLKKAQEIDDISKRIEFISKEFLTVPYKANTLIGSPKIQEKLVINLAELDCFTFVDYVLAMALSSSYDDFKINLKKIRYKQSELSYYNRNHFFSDWLENNSWLVKDISQELGAAISIKKTLNLKTDGSYYLAGIEPKARNISYIPAAKLQESKLKTGDLIGYYSKAPGLDLSHLGIVIIKKDGAYIRNASSWKSSMKVEDHQLSKLIAWGNIPGFIVYRLI